MAVSEPGEGPADGAYPPSRPLYVSGLTHIYWRAEAGQFRLDQARVTEWHEFADFGGLRDCILARLRYPKPQGHKLETYGFVPTLYEPTINVARGHKEPACWRCGSAEADELSCIVFDIDNKYDTRPRVTQDEVAERLHRLVGDKRPVEHFTYTSYSSSDERRKFRLLGETDRNLTRREMLDIFVLADERVFGGQGDGSIHDRGDFVYGPPHHTEVTVVHGAPLPVDALLAQARDLRAARPELWAPFEKAAKPALTATPEELEATRARMADHSARLEFGGIDDPAVFNPAWRDDYPMTVVQGSHYATMLSLLGRVWRKTGGRLSHGEMLIVFDEIDALAGYYMKRNYPSDKPREMVRFVMSQPVIDDVRPSADALEWRMRRLNNKLFKNGL